MPVAVFVVGCAFGTEKYNGGTLVNMLIVSLGVAIASFGESPISMLLPQHCVLQRQFAVTDSFVITLSHGCRRTELRCHWCCAPDVLYMHRIHPPCPGTDTVAEALTETEPYHHIILYCSLLFRLPSTTLCHVGGPQDHE